jgi:hypothetical protein
MKWLLIIAAAFILYKLFIHDRRRRVASEERKQEPIPPTGEMIKDPICGAFVSKDGDIRVRQGDDVHCFCSYECRDKYIKQVTSLDAEVIKEGITDGPDRKDD